MRCIIHLSIALAFCLAAALVAPAQTSAPAGTAATTHGHISAPSGAMNVGTKITTVNTARSTVTSTTANATGNSIESKQQSITAAHASTAVNTKAGGSASTIILKDKHLDALSDDPDELASELSALAGPSAGPDGGQIFIDAASL